MLDLVTFMVVAVALGMPFVVPLMWGQIEADSAVHRDRDADHPPTRVTSVDPLLA